MAIEEAVMQLNETINELNKLLKHGLQVKAESKKEEGEPKEAETEQPELEDVRNSLIQLKEAKDHQTAKDVLKSFGVQKVQDLAVEDCQKCFELCRKEAA